MVIIILGAFSTLGASPLGASPLGKTPLGKTFVLKRLHAGTFWETFPTLLRRKNLRFELELNVWILSPQTLHTPSSSFSPAIALPVPGKRRENDFYVPWITTELCSLFQSSLKRTGVKNFPVAWKKMSENVDQKTEMPAAAQNEMMKMKWWNWNDFRKLILWIKEFNGFRRWINTL